MSLSEPIAGLEPHTKAKLRSTQILTSLSQLVSELVQNSLDAGASHIEVGIDPAEWECWVRDDGPGMSTDGMESLTKGHDKGRYNTSKTYEASYAEASTFGFRGEALASAMELACLEISSRTSQARESWSVILKGGERLYLGPSLRWRREKTGTTVVCRDIFFNVPVRRRSHPNVARTLELTKKELETLALVFPRVSFSLEHTNSAQKARILTIPKTNSSLAAFRALYGKAAVERVEEINIRSEDLTIDGFISLIGSHLRGLQNFYINKHPMCFGEIQRAVEKRFATSNFGRSATNDDDKTTPRTQRSPRKTERKPVYVLNLTIPPAQLDSFMDPAKSMVGFQDPSRVVAFVLEVVNRFLARNGLISAMPSHPDGRHKAERPPGSPRKRTRRESHRPTSADGLPSFVAPGSMRGTTPSYLPKSSSTREDEDVVENLDVQDDSGYFEWVDPSSGEPFLVDANTGNSFSRGQLPAYVQSEAPSSHGSAESGQATYLDRRWLRAGDRDVRTKLAPPKWLANALKRNTTFAPGEQGVFATRTVHSNAQQSAHSHAHLHWTFDHVCASNLTQSSQLASQTFSSGDLEKAKVIAQVDAKFIACILQPTSMSRRVLALVDQHAADERVRVERYLKRLCSGFLWDEVENLQLEPPIKVLLARREVEILEQPEILSALLRWGLCVETHALLSEADAMEDHGFVQVDVRAVPDVVSNRLASRRELSEFLKGMIAAVEADGCSHWPSMSSATQDVSDWVKALRFCPAPLFELVNSRACRGAIMFNDPLDLRQCERLIAQLSATVFPFQCAHGRPSIAPLVNLNNTVPRRDCVDWHAFEEEHM